jgi:hypothetical protein
MTILKRISPASAFKVGLMVSATLGLLSGALCSVMAFAAIAPDLHARMPFMRGFGALLPVILCPILYGIAGGIVAVVAAVIYNLVSRWIGGLEVETS